MCAIEPTSQRASSPPTSRPAAISTTPNCMAPSRHSRTSAPYRGSKIRSGSSSPGSRTDSSGNIGLIVMPGNTPCRCAHALVGLENQLGYEGVDDGAQVSVVVLGDSTLALIGRPRGVDAGHLRQLVGAAQRLRNRFQPVQQIV